MSNALTRYAGGPLGGIGQQWTPQSHTYYETQWVEQDGAWPKRHKDGNLRDPSRGYGSGFPTGVYPTLAQMAGGMGLPSTGGGSQPHRSPLGSADVVTRIETAVSIVVHDLHEHGTKAGLREAARWGLTEGAQLYISLRDATEEQLSVRLAEIQAKLVKAPNDQRLLALRAFVYLRLYEVRQAIKAGQTPPQAVADRPEIPRREVPRWVPMTALAASLIALILSAGRAAR